MTAAGVKDHAKMLVAYAGDEHVARVAGVPLAQVHRAMYSGKCSPHTEMRLERLGLQDLGEALEVDSKGVTLRLRALYAMGYVIPLLVRMTDLSQSQVSEVLRGKRSGRVRRATHLKVKDLCTKLEHTPEPEGHWADNARARARQKGWLRPIELEEDLIDVPEPWASQLLVQRAQEMTYTEMNRARKSLLEGERSELVQAATVEYQLEYRRRRMAREAAV